MAHFHDGYENISVNLPHDCKVAYPELKALLDKIE